MTNIKSQETFAGKKIIPLTNICYTQVYTFIHKIRRYLSRIHVRIFIHRRHEKFPFPEIEKLIARLPLTLC